MNKPDGPLQSDSAIAGPAKSTVITSAQEAELAAANIQLESESAFLADIQKAKVVVALRGELDSRGESLSSLATRWGKTRQYVSRIFDVNERTNFTIETIVEAADLLGLRVTVQVHRPNQQVVLKSNPKYGYTPIKLICCPTKPHPETEKRSANASILPGSLAA